MKQVLFIIITLILFVGCEKDEKIPEINKEPKPVPAQLAKIDRVSLDSKSYSKIILLSRDVQKENAILELNNKAFWIENLKINSDKVTFDVIENIYYEKGFRFDTITILVDKTIIGKIPVIQTRNRISDKRKMWAGYTSLYQNTHLPLRSVSGLEITKYVYNLEKTTNGKDSYKNYPAFEYCIDMNIDPKDNMEWYLPSLEEVKKAKASDPLVFSAYARWWSATDYDSSPSYADSFGDHRNATILYKKSDDYRVYVFNAGSKEK